MKYQYKVINVGADKALEGVINNYAQLGWKVISAIYNYDLTYYTIILEYKSN